MARHTQSDERAVSPRPEPGCRDAITDPPCLPSFVFTLPENCRHRTGSSPSAETDTIVSWSPGYGFMTDLQPRETPKSIDACLSGDAEAAHDCPFARAVAAVRADEDAQDGQRTGDCAADLDGNLDDGPPALLPQAADGGSPPPSHSPEPPVAVSYVPPASLVKAAQPAAAAPATPAQPAGVFYPVAQPVATAITAPSLVPMVVQCPAVLRCGPVGVSPPQFVPGSVAAVQQAVAAPQARPLPDPKPLTDAQKRSIACRRFLGRVKSFVQETGFGFIVCPEVFSMCQQDVFLHRAQFQGLSVGQDVVFSIEFNKQGKPQARNVTAAPQPRVQLQPDVTPYLQSLPHYMVAGFPVPVPV